MQQTNDGGSSPVKNYRDVGRADDERDLQSGSDLPHGDGSVSDDDLKAVERGGVNNKNAATGQDHSTDNHEAAMPTSGVGAIQNASDTTSDIAHLEE